MTSTNSSMNVSAQIAEESNGPSCGKRKSVKGETQLFRKERKIKNLRIDLTEVADLPDCASKCNTKTSKEERQIIWEEFRVITEIDQRYLYLAQLIKVSAPKRFVVPTANRKVNRDKIMTYYVKSNQASESLLCKKCFMTIFRLSPAKIRTIVNKKVENGQSPNIQYKRGKHEPGNKITESDRDEASLFLLSVPAYESHYGRSESQKQYLPDYHTKTSLFEDFKGTYPHNRVNYSIFCKIFKDLNLSIKSKACDTCKTCDALKVRLDSAMSEEIRVALKEEQEAHWKKWKAAINQKKKDASIAAKDHSVKVVSYDLEQILPTPFLTTSVAFYSRQLSTLNLTIFDLVGKTSTHNIWHEGMASRGSNEINSCLYNYASNLPATVTHLIKYSDRCYGQNLNINSVIADLFLVQQSPSLKTIDSKFLVSGHTHMECDIAHAVIERYKKRYKKNIEVPADWATLIEEASDKFNVKLMTAGDFYDFSENLKEKLVYRKVNTKKEPWKFEQIYWFRVEESNPFGFKYKTSFDSSEPFKEVNLTRKNNKGKVIQHLIANQKYANDNENPIKKEKKKDLLQLLKFISPDNHQFYKDLKEEPETHNNK